jgi:hypothetical protein
MEVSYLCAYTYYVPEALNYGGWPTPQALSRPEEALRSHRINFDLALRDCEPSRSTRRRP